MEILATHPPSDGRSSGKFKPSPTGGTWNFFLLKCKLTASQFHIDIGTCMQMSVIESLTCAWAASFFFLLFCGRPSRLHKVRNRDGISPTGSWLSADAGNANVSEMMIKHFALQRQTTSLGRVPSSRWTSVAPVQIFWKKCLDFVLVTFGLFYDSNLFLEFLFPGNLSTNLTFFVCGDGSAHFVSFGLIFSTNFFEMHIIR